MDMPPPGLGHAPSLRERTTQPPVPPTFAISPCLCSMSLPGDYMIIMEIRRGQHGLKACRRRAFDLQNPPSPKS